MAKNYIKNQEEPVQKYRFAVQMLFVLICIWIGYEYFHFAKFLESNGNAPYSARPAGAEGFLPISALMSVYYFFLSGDVHSVHPAGFFIFVAIVSVSLIFSKSFCSWVCPVGFISEYVGEFGNWFYKKVLKLKKTPTLPKWIDYPLRSLKYLLLAFFAYAIFFSMTEASLKYFLDSPYNIIADVKMYYFFKEITPLAIYILTGLLILSIFVRNFWCRYLCPYGALLGFISILSPNKISRNSESCIDCAKCAKVCPSKIKVDKVKTVVSDECTSCLNCVDVCPVANTLVVKPIKTKFKFKPFHIGLIILAVYFSIVGTAIITNNWNNQVSKEEYIKLYKVKDSVGHPRSAAEIEELNKKIKTNH